MTFEKWWKSRPALHDEVVTRETVARLAWLVAWHQGRAAGLLESQELIEELHAHFIEDSDIGQWGRRVVEKLKNRRAAVGET